MHLVDGIILPLFANVFFTIISFKITKNCTAHLVFTKKQARKYNFPAVFILFCSMFFFLHMPFPVLIRRISIYPFKGIDQSSGIRKSTIQRNIQN